MLDTKFSIKIYSKKNFNKKIDLKKFSNPITFILIIDENINIIKKNNKILLLKLNINFILPKKIYKNPTIKNKIILKFMTVLPIIRERGIK